ncbi:MAG TPA: MarR family transcriptional regulator [Cellulomonas sp.]
MRTDETDPGPHDAADRGPDGTGRRRHHGWHGRGGRGHDPAEDGTGSPGSDRGPVGQGDELFWLLRTTLRRLRRDVRDQLAPFELNPSQHRLLRTVARVGEPQRQTALAAALDVVPRSVTSVVDDLEQAGLVERRPDPTDRRATLVALTEAGRQVLAAADAERRRRADDLLARLSEAERADLLRLLHVLAD